jgi:HTH-type transcriptional regulator / antitoxin HipB
VADIIASPADLGRMIRRIRTAQHLSQRELADRLGVSQRYLSEWESGKPKTADERYFDLLSRLGITLTARADD